MKKCFAVFKALRSRRGDDAETARRFYFPDEELLQREIDHKHIISESIAALRFYMVFTFTFRRSFGDLPPLKGEGDRLAVEGSSEQLNVRTTDGRG